MQRFIGVVLGALATYLILVLFAPKDGSDATSVYLTAAVVGAIVSFLWPWVIGLMLARRAKARRDDRIEDEVQRQLAEEKAKQG
jgi:hypothetical protein